MLSLFDHLEFICEEQDRNQWMYESKLPFFVSDILDMLNIKEKEESVLAIRRTINAFLALNIPVSKNMKKIYRFNGGSVEIDWKISSLASYLLIINCDPGNENVAKAQLYFAMNR